MGIDRHYPVLAGSVVCLSRMGVATGEETGSKTASPPGPHTFLSIPPGAGSDIGDFPYAIRGHVRSGHFRSRRQAVTIRRMICKECGQRATGCAEGREALLVDLDDDGQDEVVFYCTVCAEREFHPVE